MPLDAKVRELLNLRDDAPPIGTVPVETMSKEAPAQMAELFRMGLVSTPVAAVEDRLIPGSAGDVPVRVYTPQGRGPFPVVVFFHGGGWVLGDLDTHDPLCRSLCAGAGCTVVSVGYRLAPEHRFPAAVDDALAAVRWVAEHAAEVGGDPARIAVAGDSAGGNLSAVTALRLRDEGARYVERLRAAGVPAQLSRYDGVHHRFAEMLGILEKAEQAHDEMCAWLRETLASPSTVTPDKDIGIARPT
jgi:acetyl esterase